MCLTEDKHPRAGRHGASGAIVPLTRRSKVWTLLRTPAADVSVVYNSFARVWGFLVHVPVSASCFQPVAGCGTHCENPMAGGIDLSE